MGMVRILKELKIDAHWARIRNAQQRLTKGLRNARSWLGVRVGAGGNETQQQLLALSILVIVWQASSPFEG